MALFNYATKEITLKVVYYGPGLSGKTTNLQYLHSVLNPETRGKLLSLSTESDRTLFFDFLPFELGKIRDFSVRFQLYTVPGQVRYNATRKVVLKGADAVVFVADSQREMSDQNVESYENMKENLASNNINPDEIPVVMQFNKRDLKNISSVDELNLLLNSEKHLFIEASAIEGRGVEETFKLVSKLVLKYIARKHKIEVQEDVAAGEPPAVSREESRTDAPPPAPPPPQQRERTASPPSRPVSTADSSPPDNIGAIQSRREKEVTASAESIARTLAGLEKLTAEVSEMKQSLSLLQKNVNELRESSKEQGETYDIVREILTMIQSPKKKRSWFRF